MAAVALVCPTCGGALGPVERGVARCPFCNGRALFAEGTLRRVGTFRLRAHTTEPEARGLVEAALRRAGFDPVPALAASEDHVRYLLRRGRVRAEHAGQGESAVEATYGVPWGDAHGGALVLTEDGDLEPVDAEVPEGLPSELLRFEDHLATTLAADRRLRTGAGAPVEVRHAAWTDEVSVVDVPVWRFAFSATDLRDTLARAWSDRRPDGRYEVVVDRSSGQLLSFRAPQRGVNPTTVLVVFLLVVTVPGMVGMALGVLGAVLGVVVSAATN